MDLSEFPSTEAEFRARFANNNQCLTALAGGADGVENEYLYRFALGDARAGNRVRVYTLGSRGQDYFKTELGVPVAWYFRPDKVRHLSFGQLMHNLLLTRF